MVVNNISNLIIKESYSEFFLDLINNNDKSEKITGFSCDKAIRIIAKRLAILDFFLLVQSDIKRGFLTELNWKDNTIYNKLRQCNNCDLTFFNKVQEFFEL